MTPEAKRLLSKTIRDLRARLLDELHQATDSEYRLSLSDKAAKLSEQARMGRRRLLDWVQEQERALPKKELKAAQAEQRFVREVEKDAAATLVNRLVYLRLLEAAGLQQEKVLTGGWESLGYKQFREYALELVDDATEGYATLLQLVFDELAQELPGLYGPVRLTGLIPIPAASLRTVVEALEQPGLASCWSDDLTLGWVYQYWNDPEREALDAKLNESQKLQNHELGPKTQMFTERYMVEWLLHNSLGQQWLALCKKHGWTPEAEADGTLQRLEERRTAWRAQREAGQVQPQELMPIEGPAEERWKYWVPQPLPEDAPGAVPDSIRELKLLDPACGSGHFLVTALELLLAMYQEEARHRGESSHELWSDRTCVESILEHNLHGIDIDPRAVQIAAAALMLKARKLAPEAAPKQMNLVAPQLRLGQLAKDDPALQELRERLQHEVDLPPVLTDKLVEALAGADHLGTLLKVESAVQTAIDEADHGLSAPGTPTQGDLYAGFAPEKRTPLQQEAARKAIEQRLAEFVRRHSSRADLGLRLRGEQLVSGLHLVQLLRPYQYDLVVGNPPYQGTSKMADASYVKKHYPTGKADLYAAFLERGLQLVKDGGISALLTMRNWMFIKQYADLREKLLGLFDLRLLGDVDRGAFEEVPDEVVAAVMSVFERKPPSEVPSLAMQPTPLEDKSRDGERTKRKRAAVLCQVGRFEFEPASLKVVPEWPLVYWWGRDFLAKYSSSTKFGASWLICKGLTTCNNPRFVRAVWEVKSGEISARRANSDLRPGELHKLLCGSKWVPWIDGGQARQWQHEFDAVVCWRLRGIEIATAPINRYGRGEEVYFQPGVAFSMIGATFRARKHRYRSIIGNMGASLYGEDLSYVNCEMNSARAQNVLESLNPGTHFEKLDVERLPVLSREGSEDIEDVLEMAFSEHESHREPSYEFKGPGPSCLSSAFRWASNAINVADGAPLEPFVPEVELPDETSYLSFAVGVALGRFEECVASASRCDGEVGALGRMLYLSPMGDDSLADDTQAGSLPDVWNRHCVELGKQGELRDYLRLKFFQDVHRQMYENRPIYFPLSSQKRNFVAYVSIHSWSAATLRALLAGYLQETLRRIDGESDDLRSGREQSEKTTKRSVERRLEQLNKWREELLDFIAKVEQCAEQGPPPVDSKTPPRERDARYEMDLDDGVMINSAALWPLLEPQWKDPKKWWKELATASGKKDYDWSHLAARYFPTRVMEKCHKDPSLAVAHGCFWKLHPELAYKWELRLQDEIGPDFRLDEEARSPEEAYTPEWVQSHSDAYRAAFEAEQPNKVEALIAAEKKRRKQKAKKKADAKTKTANGGKG